MNDSETQSEYKIIETKLNEMERVLDNYIEKTSYPTIKQIQAQNIKSMSLRQALNIVLELVENTINDEPKCVTRSNAITKVKNFIQQL